MPCSSHFSRPALPSRRALLCLLTILNLPLLTGPVTLAQTSRPIEVLRPKKLAGESVPTARTPLGIPNDYKPFLARLNSGDLLIVAFCLGPIEGVDGYAERAVFWRSKDGGRTWGARQERLDIQGREFGLTTLHDGTLLMTCHWLARVVFNPS